MKKLLIIIMVFCSCSNNKSIKGKWFIEGPGSSYANIFIDKIVDFRDSVYTVTDLKTNEVLSYNYKIEGDTMIASSKNGVDTSLVKLVAMDTAVITNKSAGNITLFRNEKF